MKDSCLTEYSIYCVNLFLGPHLGHTENIPSRAKEAICPEVEKGTKGREGGGEIAKRPDLKENTRVGHFIWGLFVS